MDWSSSEMLKAVRTTLNAWRWDSHLTFESAELRGDLMLVSMVHHLGGATERLGVYYSFADAPAGPNTGLECASPSEWASEVARDVEEFVSYETNERRPGPDGLVIVRWWSTDSISRP